MKCSLMGESYTPPEIRDLLKEKLTGFVEEKGVDFFYIGDHGDFEKMALSVVKELCGTYPHIGYSVVLTHRHEQNDNDLSNVVYPEGIEALPEDAALSFRNIWMIDRADIAIVYARHLMDIRSSLRIWQKQR